MRFVTSTLVAGMAVAALGARSHGQKPPPVHFIDRPLASSTHDYKLITSVRALPNGDLLVNDALRKQLLIVDSALAMRSIIADSGGGSTNPYGGAFAGLIPYAGDSTAFILPRVPSMYMIDPSGKVVRVLSVPRPQDVFAMTSLSTGGSSIDSKGRWVYRGNTPGATRPTLVAGGPPGWMIGADSAPIVRYDAMTHVFDTITKFRVTQLKAKMYPQDANRTRAVILQNPAETVDDWAMLSDGTVAILRGQDYHIDFVNPDGSTTRGPKMAYAWEPLSDDAKIALIDSLKKADEDSKKKSGPAQPMTLGAGGGSSAGGSSSSTSSGTGSAAGTSSMGVSSNAGSPNDNPPPEFPSPSELPDYRPPFEQRAARADADGNLWIKTKHHEASAGAVYDVVNRQGKVIDRVQLQPGRSIIGFARGGVVFMLAGEETREMWLEKTKWRAP